jgi:P2 family phage contractile tail tube protein
MQPLYILEAVDVRRADQAGSSRALTISKMAIPAIKRVKAEHKPGGGVGNVQFTFPQIEAIEPKFELKGFDPDIIGNLGFASGVADKWVFAGACRDRRTGRSLPARAVIQGIVAEWEPTEWSVGEVSGVNHVIQEVTYYEFTLDGVELWHWDFWGRVGRSGGRSWFGDVVTALGA